MLVSLKLPGVVALTWEVPSDAQIVTVVMALMFVPKSDPAMTKVPPLGSPGLVMLKVTPEALAVAELEMTIEPLVAEATLIEEIVVFAGIPSPYTYSPPTKLVVEIADIVVLPEVVVPVRVANVSAVFN